MTLIETLWLIAAFVIGYISIDILARICRLVAPMIYRLAFGGVMVLVAYTYLLPHLPLR